MSKFIMHSGQLIDFDSIKENDILLDDIAHHLAKIQRFNGAAPIGVSYTVGEHCINLVNYCLNNQTGVSRLGIRMLLLHDASEAYLSDLVSPVKAELYEYRVLENKVQKLINKKFIGIWAAGLGDSTGLKDLDKRILLDEVKAIMPDKYELYKNETGLEPLGCHIEFNNHPATIKQCFLKLCKELYIYEKTTSIASKRV